MSAKFIIPLFHFKSDVDCEPAPFPFSMLYRNDASLPDSKSAVISERGGKIGEVISMRGEIWPGYSRRAECLNTFVAHRRIFLFAKYVTAGVVC